MRVCLTERTNSKLKVVSTKQDEKQQKKQLQTDKLKIPSADVSTVFKHQRQTDRQTDRQAGRQTGRQAGRQTEQYKHQLPD